MTLAPSIFASPFIGIVSGSLICPARTFRTTGICKSPKTSLTIASALPGRPSDIAVRHATYDDSRRLFKLARKYSAGIASHGAGRLLSYFLQKKYLSPGIDLIRRSHQTADQSHIASRNTPFADAFLQDCKGFSVKILQFPLFPRRGQHIQEITQCRFRGLPACAEEGWADRSPVLYLTDCQMHSRNVTESGKYRPILA